MALLFYVLSASGAIVFSQDQTPKRAEPSALSPTPAVQNDKGIIRGRVTVGGGRAPGNTTVSLRALNEGSRASRMTRVDQEGRFVFDDLPTAVYAVLATAPGYIDETIASGDTLTLPHHLLGSQLRLRMIKGGVITGVVTNHKGEPVVGVGVRAAMIGDRRDLITMFGAELTHAETDDRGVYRIYGLPSGQYVVAAGGRGPFGPYVASGFDLDAPTYYPSATRDTAVPVTVESGEESTSINIKYRGVPGHAISGVVKPKVISPSNINIATVTLSDVKTDTVLSMAAAGAENPDRSFRFDGVDDGDYELLATFFTTPTANWSTGTTRVSVRGNDVTGLELALTPLASIEGSMKLHPTETKCDKRGSQLVETILAASTKSSKKNYIRRFRSIYPGFIGTLKADNTFAVRNLEPGKFQFRIQLPTDAWYVKEIVVPSPAPKPMAQSPKVQETVVWQGTGTLKVGEELRGVTVTVGQDAAALRGTVNLPKGLSSVPEGFQVHLVPVEHEQQNNVLRYFETDVDRDGRFSLSHIAPGRYFIVTRTRPAASTDAQERPDPAAWDASVRAKLRRDAETANVTVELKPCQQLNDHAFDASP